MKKQNIYIGRFLTVEYGVGRGTERICGMIVWVSPGKEYFDIMLSGRWNTEHAITRQLRTKYVNETK